MPCRRAVAGFGVACCLWLAPAGLSAQRQDTKELLQRVAAYVRSYERSFSAVVCEERYSQRARLENGWETRALHSEAALVQVDGEDWRLFRDVLSVDGVRVQDRGSRLVDLFGRGDRAAAGEAARITEESARYNIGPVARTLNVPTLALAFLREGDQKRSRFTIGSRSRKDGHEIVDLRFEERDRPRMIYTRDRAPATGRAWVDAADGTVRGTELRVHSEGMLASIMVTYRHDDTLALWVPEMMNETYYSGVRRADTGVATFDRLPANLGPLIDGHATYANCRKFRVDIRLK